MSIALTPIGFVKNNEKKHFGGWDKILTDIEINEEYKEALDGLEEYSHLIVIYWLHEVRACDLRHVPQGKVGIAPEVGIFACRCPQRPNPIDLSTVKIIGIKENIITVKGLDVINNTPIFDIKPYTPQYDAAKNVKVPEWVNKLAY